MTFGKMAHKNNLALPHFKKILFNTTVLLHFRDEYFSTDKSYTTWPSKNNLVSRKKILINGVIHTHLPHKTCSIMVYINTLMANIHLLFI